MLSIETYYESALADAAAAAAEDGETLTAQDEAEARERAEEDWRADAAEERAERDREARWDR